MLKTKPLNQLLSQSISPNVSSALLFTPSGSLLATGTSPTAPDAKKSRTYSALAANIWSAYERVAVQGVIEQSLPSSTTQDLSDAAVSEPATPNPNSGLKSLTLELSDYNLHIQLVAPRVLLCLIGPKTPTRHTSSSSSLHSQEGDKGTPPGSVPKSGGSGGSAGTPVQGSMGSGMRQGMGSLGILKTQAQALVDYLEKELRGFELPEGI